MNTLAALCMLTAVGQVRSFGVTNDHTTIELSAGATRADRVYREGESLELNVKASKTCYVYVLNENGEGSVVMLFPNKHQQQNQIRANETVILPDPNSGVRYPAQPPFGKEKIYVIASIQPLACFQDLPWRNSQSGVTQVPAQTDKQFGVERRQQNQRDYAVTTIDVLTVASGGPVQVSEARYGLCIGISDFLYVRDLTISHYDAEHMSRTLQSSCGVSAQNVVLLQNSAATKAEIKRQILRLAEISKPHDKLYIFFSCHGGTCADVDGDEADKIDEYIVPHDGNPAQTSTMILDDEFGNWIKQLTGRRVFIILDNCFSGGASKALTAAPKGLEGTDDFFFDEFVRRSEFAKDLDQTDTVVLAASRADEPAWEMKNENYSVFTFYLTEALKNGQADGDGDGRISAKEAFGYYDPKVQQYVRREFAAPQHPLVFDNSNGQASFGK
jgi:hypothetical protein